MKQQVILASEKNSLSEGVGALVSAYLNPTMLTRNETGDNIIRIHAEPCTQGYENQCSPSADGKVK